MVQLPPTETLEQNLSNSWITCASCNLRIIHSSECDGYHITETSMESNHVSSNKNCVSTEKENKNKSSIYNETKLKT